MIASDGQLANRKARGGVDGHARRRLADCDDQGPSAEDGAEKSVCVNDTRQPTAGIKPDPRAE